MGEQEVGKAQREEDREDRERLRLIRQEEILKVCGYQHINTYTGTVYLGLNGIAIVFNCSTAEVEQVLIKAGKDSRLKELKRAKSSANRTDLELVRFWYIIKLGKEYTKQVVLGIFNLTDLSYGDLQRSLLQAKKKNFDLEQQLASAVSLPLEFYAKNQENKEKIENYKKQVTDLNNKLEEMKKEIEATKRVAGECLKQADGKIKSLKKTVAGLREELLNLQETEEAEEQGEDYKEPAGRQLYDRVYTEEERGSMVAEYVGSGCMLGKTVESLHIKGIMVSERHLERILKDMGVYRYKSKKRKNQYRKRSSKSR